MTKKEGNRRCRERYKKRLKLKKCSVCGTEFIGTDKQKNCDAHKYGKNVKRPLNIVYKNCKTCGKVFFGKRKYCSPECYDKYIDGLRKSKIKKKCGYCGREIEISPCHVRDNNFCDRKCFALYKFNKPNYKIRGANHPGWKGGVKKRDNSTLKAKRWREKVFKKDGYRCVFCGEDRNLMAHHLVAWADDVQLRFYITNGITLCKECHKKIHGRNFVHPINYENTQNKCKEQGIKLRKKISNRIEELIRERANRDGEKS